MNEYHWGTTTSYDHYDNILCIGSISTKSKQTNDYHISPHITIHNPDAFLKLDSTQSISFDPTHKHCKAYLELAHELNKPLYFIQGHYKHQQFILDNFLQITQNQTQDITFSYHLLSETRS
jgi:hypothetical protein